MSNLISRRRLVVVFLLLSMISLWPAMAQTKQGGAPLAAPVAPQTQMAGLARKLGLGAPRADSPVPQPTRSGVGQRAAGFYQCFERGCVYSSPAGVRAVYGTIFSRYVQDGAEHNALGFPLTDEQPCRIPAGMRYQRFEGGRILWRAADNHTARSPMPGSGDPADCTGNEVYAVPPATESLGIAPPRQKAVPAKPSESGFVPAAPASGRFRVTLNGFRVMHETADHSLEVDGKRDEVFILAEVGEFNGAGEVLNRTSPESAVMGDIQGFGTRLRAGEASDLGGLRSSDSVPPTEPWRRAGVAGTTRPPMLLWEGTLTQGQRAVVIVPTIWEWDGPTDVRRQYVESMAGTFGRYVRSLSASETNFANFLAPMTGAAGSSRVVGFEPTGNAADRPIGVSVRTGSFLAANEEQQGVEWFTPQRLLLSYDLARQAAADTRQGFGPGIFQITYRDHPELAGVYALYIQVERLD